MAQVLQTGEFLAACSQPSVPNPKDFCRSLAASHCEQVSSGACFAVDWNRRCFSLLLCHGKLGYCFKTLFACVCFRWFDYLPKSLHILLPHLPLQGRSKSTSMTRYWQRLFSLEQPSLLSRHVLWSHKKKLQRKGWFKCSSRQVSGKVAHESHVPFPNSPGWRRSLVLKLFDFNLIFTSVWILIAVAWNTSILIPGYTLCLVKNGDGNFPGTGQCFRPTALLKPWLPAVFQSCTVAFYKPWNTVCKSNHLPKLVITKVNDLFIRTSTLALPHAVN